MKIVDIASVDLHFLGLVFLEDLYELGPTEAQFQGSHNIAKVLKINTRITRNLAKR